MLAVGECCADQEVAVIQVDRDDAGLAGIGEVLQRGFLHGAQAGRHEHVVVFREGAVLARQRQYHGDLLVVLQREHVHDRLAARIARALRHFPYLQPVHAAAVGEAQDVVVRVRDEQLVDPVLFLGHHRLLAAPAAFLRTVLGDRRRLHVTGVRQGHDHVLRGDQVFGSEVGRIVFDRRAARILAVGGVLVHHLAHLVGDDRGDALGTRQDIQQVGDVRHHFFVLVDDLVLLKAGQALQAHLQDFLCLLVRQLVHAVLLHAVVLRQVLGAERLDATGGAGFGTAQHFAHQGRIPGALHQFRLRDRRRWRSLDDRDEVVNVRQCDRQAFQHVAALARLAQVVHGAARNHFAAVLQEAHQHLLQVQQLRLAVDQRHHVHAEGVLQLGLLVQVVQHNLWHFAALELNHHAHARLVGLVADVGDAFELLVAHVLGDPLEQRLLVDLVRQLVDDDRDAAAVLAVFFEVGLGAHDDAATASAVAVAHTGHAVDDAGGREVRGRNQFDQFVDRAVRVVQYVQRALDHFRQVVRRDIGRHADRDTRRAVDQQVRDAGREYGRLLFLAVVVRLEVDGVLVDIGQHFAGDLVEAALGVTHRRGAVAVDRAEVTLAVDQRVAQREVLGHAHQRVVNRRVAVRVVLTHRLADHARALDVRAVVHVVHLVHGEQDAAVHWLEAVAHIRQGTPYNHAHRVIEVALAHLFFEGNRDCFFGELIHWRVDCSQALLIGETARNDLQGCFHAVAWPSNSRQTREGF